jgi:hypothetical protein
MITSIGILTGALLATRYRVLCLVPVTLVGTAVIAALDHVNEVPLGSTALNALALVVGLQIGYLARAALRSVLPMMLAGGVSAPQRRRDLQARIF